MKISNHTSLDLEPLVRAVVRRAGLKDTRRLFMSLRTRQHGTRCSGTAWATGGYYRGYKEISKAFGAQPGQPVFLSGRITIGVPAFYNRAFGEYPDPLALVENLTETLTHEVGHLWDAQRHGTARWVKGRDKSKWAWADRPQEFTAKKYAKEKMATLPLDIQDEMLRLAIAIEERMTDKVRRHLVWRITNLLRLGWSTNVAV